MDYITVKLRNGADLIGIREYQDESVLLIRNPVEIIVDPNYGFFAKSWHLLFEDDVVNLQYSDILLHGAANKKAIRYYEEFYNQMRSKSSTNTTSDKIEDILTTMIESKGSIKH